MTPVWCTALPGGVRLVVQVAPNAKKTHVVGVFDDALKLRLQAPPVDGKANAALIVFLAGALGVPRSAVVISHGQTSKRKLIAVTAPGLTPAQVELLLTP